MASKGKSDFIAGVLDEYPEMAAKAAQGDQLDASWIIGADQLLSMTERNRRPRPKHYGKSARPTLDDFDRPAWFD
jgi:hypothetical protein